MTMDFANVGAVDIKTVTVVDIEVYEDESYYSAGGSLLKSVRIKPVGNNSVKKVEVHATGVLVK